MMVEVLQKSTTTRYLGLRVRNSRKKKEKMMLCHGFFRSKIFPPRAMPAHFLFGFWVVWPPFEVCNKSSLRSSVSARNWCLHQSQAITGTKPAGNCTKPREDQSRHKVSAVQPESQDGRANALPFANSESNQHRYWLFEAWFFIPCYWPFFSLSQPTVSSHKSLAMKKYKKTLTTAKNHPIWQM